MIACYFSIVPNTTEMFPTGCSMQPSNQFIYFVFNCCFHACIRIAGNLVWRHYKWL